MYHPPKDTTFSTRSKMAGLIPFSLDMDKILSRSNAQRMKTSIPKPMNLTVSTTRVPETVAEWNQALANIKRDYLNRRYRPCSTRCRELLHGAKHTRTAEAAHLIYLHFYAASALEMQAQSLSTSPYRTQLLDQARVHYRRASELTNSESDATSDWSRSSSPTSLFSPAPSESMWMTRACSPTSTVSSLVSPTDCAAPIKKHKRVTFSFDSVTEPFTEPFVRPDSPTLGFDEWLGRSSPDLIENKENTIFVFPEPPKSPQREESSALHIDTVLSPSFEDDGYPFPRTSTSSHRPTFIDPFQQDRSIHRYTSTLHSLQRQIATHLNAIEEPPAAFPPPPPNEEDRKMDLRARIERLRANGWQRKRFDAKRYESLRESALADLE